MNTAPLPRIELSDRLEEEKTRAPASELRLVTDEDMKIQVCPYGPMYGTHKEKLINVGGDWKTMPKDFNFINRGIAATCPDCEAQYNRTYSQHEIAAKTARAHWQPSKLKPMPAYP